jgi:1,2-dihydroxy-3-keto-5-methylthiopentene dioxygenase
VGRIEAGAGRAVQSRFTTDHQPRERAMSTLTICPDTAPERRETFKDFNDIVVKLAEIGVEFERWDASRPLALDAGQDEVIAAYHESIDALSERYGFQSVDVVALRPDNPKKGELRRKFLAEHTHDDFEVRFFVDGRGLFYLHVGSKVYMILCERGDLISVPADTTHWFDMGAEPDFKCIRLFTQPDGWVGDFTGSDIATRFPDFDQYVASVT